MFVPYEEALAHLDREAKEALARCIRHEPGSAGHDFYGKEYMFLESLAAIAERIMDEEES